ncbi:hypothetical protein TARUN_4165 [Trichoderma arundinaceum]|uniref:Phytanoyl-dioxygenase family n=1 Tax=Trichoderma arundinaceum TaxID=490622 RepID=A0A395NQ92_TRIAR|nr:hypothetical protein TARUN_4165 [Trichoderma arundinaceum]
MSNQRRMAGGSIPNEVGADKRLHSPALNPPDTRTQQLIDQVTTHGYVIIHNAFTPEAVASAKAEVARLTDIPEAAGPAGKKGRNTFEGYKTQRLYALANKSRVFDAFALHEDVLALNDHFLDPGYLINSFQSINILPGEKAQTLHYDHGYVTIERPHRPVGSGVMIALDDYTANNGATVIVPDSHKWDSKRVPSAEETIPVIMPAGSIIYFLSTLWHGGGANTSNASRLALTAQYCQPWIRPMENLILAVDWEKLDEIPERLVGMLGYKVGNPFIGFVDGGSPRAAVARLLAKWTGKSGKGKIEAKL